jgi:hypothetical protein
VIVYLEGREVILLYIMLRWYTLTKLPMFGHFTYSVP